MLNCRVAAAGLAIREVPSVERARIFGKTNLRTFSDGFRVLVTIVTECRRQGTRYRLARRRLWESGAKVPCRWLKRIRRLAHYA